MKFWRVIIRAREVQEIVLFGSKEAASIYDGAMYGRFGTTQRINHPWQMPKKGEANFYVNAVDELGAFAAFQEWMGREK